MFRTITVAALVCVFAATAFAQSQTPRQALIEMLSGRDAKTFERHLPKIMQARLASLMDKTGQNFMKSPADFPTSMGRKGEMRWFETGPILLMAQDANWRMEVRVEKENLSGERCDLELSFAMNMDSQSPTQPNDTRVLLTMIKEDTIWRLSEFGLTFKMKLDGSFIEALSQQFGAIQSGTTSTLTRTVPISNRTMSAADLTPDEIAALDVVRDLLLAETRYRSADPNNGFTCDPGELGVGEVRGYRAMIVGCKGTPVASFKVTLTPIGMGIKGRRAFCSDESGVIRYSDDGRGLSCLSEDNRIQ